MTHIYEKGQLVIPKYFRDLLGWKKDTEVRFEVQGDKLIVQKQKSIAQELEEFANEIDVGPIPEDTDILLEKMEIEEYRRKYKDLGLDI